MRPTLVRYLFSPSAGLVNVFVRDVLGLPWLTFNVFSMAGLVLVTVLHTFPYVYLLASSALQSVDASYEEAAQILGASKFRTALSITAPLVAPAILSGNRERSGEPQDRLETSGRLTPLRTGLAASANYQKGPHRRASPVQRSTRSLTIPYCRRPTNKHASLVVSFGRINSLCRYRWARRWGSSAAHAQTLG